MNKRGFTLIELILYVALIGIFLTGAVLFMWDVIYSGAKSRTEREVNQNLRLAGKRISYEIRNAASVLSIAQNAICLSSADANRDPTKIYTADGQLRISWGGNSDDCRGMTYDQPLTGTRVSVSDLSFTDRSGGTPFSNIEYSFTVSSVSDRKEWQKSEIFQGSAELRSK